MKEDITKQTLDLLLPSHVLIPTLSCSSYYLIRGHKILTFAEPLLPAPDEEENEEHIEAEQQHADDGHSEDDDQRHIRSRRQGHGSRYRGRGKSKTVMSKSNERMST